MKITIKDIAKLADVSTATVSKVINKKDENISEVTRQRVLEIAKEQGYVPNRIASSMITKKTHSIGLVIPDIANPFFPELARGAEDMASSRGYNIILCNSDNNISKEDSYIEMLQEKMVDGIIFTSSSRRLKTTESLKRVNIPVITVDRDIEGVITQGKITVDNEFGAYEAVEYLISRKYSKILHISGPLSSKPARDRLQGYKKALQDNGIELDESYIFEGDYTITSGYDNLINALNEKISFDGVFCANDLIALGVIKALKEYNITIPEKVGVIGFDDIAIASMLDPELTTVKQPNYQMGYKAAELLINMLENKKLEQKEYILKTNLVIRKSTK